MRNISAPAPYLTRRKLYTAMVTATQLMWAGQAQASPEGGNVVGGAGTIIQSGKETIIHQQTDRMAIDWQSFNVKADEHVQFAQPSASSVALNRVIGNKGSEILGRIDANGQVFLVNPNGVVFGKDSQINVGGILASGLSINPTDFMNGNFTFSEVEGAAGKVVNSGIINAATGGSVTLIGKEVTNDGLIIANLGAVNLAVGKEAVVTFEKNGLVGIKVTKEVLQSELGVDAALVNSGEINADGGRILLTASTSQDIFSQAVNHEGMNAATSVVVNDDGSFTLGGGADAVNTGKISTSVTNGNAGDIVVIGERVTNSGAISADSKVGSGGHIELNSKDTTILNQTASVSAQSTINGKGGDVKILGDKVGLMDTASVNASGANGGGQTLIGGDETGKNKSINNANFIYLGENTNVKTDALLNGNGGKLITFAQDTARIYGNLSARGGIEGGNGGFIETSGLKGFEILDAPDISAQNGLGGGWLIDPYNLTINNSNGISLNNGVFESSASNSNLSGAILEAAIKNNVNITVRTGLPVSPATTAQLGDITVSRALNFSDIKNNSGTLTLEAANNIEINENIIASDSDGKLNIVLKANGHGYTNVGMDVDNGNIIFNSGVRVETKGGDFTATGKNFILKESSNNVDSILTNGGNVSLTMTGSVVLSGENSVTNPGTNTIATNGGNFTVIDSKGFDSKDATIDTSSSNSSGGGAIKITSTGGSTNHVDLGVLKFGYSPPGGNNPSASSRVGSVTVESNGDVILWKSLDFDDSGFHGSDSAFLNVTAKGAITLKEKIYDSGAGNVDALNISFNADSSITLDQDIYTAGGNLYLSANSLVLNGHTLDTENADAGQNQNSTRSIGGKVTLKSSIDFVLGNVITDTTCGNQSPCGDFAVESKVPFSDNISISQGAGKVLNISGDSSFYLGAGDLTLENNNIFTRTLSFVKAHDVTILNSSGATTTLDTSEITGDFKLKSSSDVVDSGVLTVAGETTIDAAGKSITLDANNDFGIVKFSSAIANLTLKDINALTLGSSVTTNGTTNRNVNVSAGGVLTTGAITTSTNANNTSAGQIILTGSGGIELGGNLTAKGGTNGTGTAGSGGKIELKNNVSLLGSVTIDTSGPTSRGDISFSGNIYSPSSSTRNLSLTGKGITFNGNVGDNATNRIGAFTVDTTADFGTNAKSFYATSFDLTAQNIFANILDSFGGNVTLKGTNTVTVNEITAQGVATNQSGGNVTVDGTDITLGNLNNVAINSAGDGTGLAGDVKITATEDGTPSITIKGNINSGSKVTALKLAGTTTDGKVDLSSFTSASGFASSLLITGSGGNDTLTGNSIANTWNVASGTIKRTSDVMNSLAPVTTYTGFKNISGGTNADTFEITAAFAGGIDGGAGNDIFNIGTASLNANQTLITTLVGGGDADILNGANLASTWVLGGTVETLSKTTTPNNKINFSGIENIKAGDLVDTFEVSGTLAQNRNVDAAGGDDVINVDNDLEVSLESGFSFNSVKNAEVVSSKNQGKLTVTSSTGATVNWKFDTENSVSTKIVVNNVEEEKKVKFINFDSFVGGDGNDIFTVANSINISGLIDGANGTNSFNVSGNRTVAISGSDTSYDLTVTRFKNINVTGATNSTLLTVGNSSNTWNISDENAGDINGVNFFTGFNNLTGSDGTDTFDFSSAANNGSISGVIDGGLGSNTVKARVAVANTWKMASNTSGSLGLTASLPSTYVNEFKSIQNFIGSNSGVNTMDFSGFAGIVKINLGTGVSGASDITSFIGNYVNNTSPDSEIVGANTFNEWEINGANKGKVGSITFEKFNKLTGGSVNDDFLITSSGSFAGTISGGTGTNTLTRNGSAAVGWVLTSAKSGNVGSTTFFVDMDSIIGSGLDSLTGRDQDNSWNISGANSGTLRSAASAADQISFEGMSILIGQTGKDNFTLKTSGSLTGTINGGTGTAKNSLKNENAGATWTLDKITTLSGKLNSQSFQNIHDLLGSGTDNLVGRSQNNDWQISSANAGSVQLVTNAADLTSFTGMANLTGNALDDSFTIANGASITNTINGGVGGVNKLISNTANATWILDSTTAFKGTVSGKSFVNISEIVGNAGNLTGRDQANTWVISGPGSGSVRATDATISDKINFSGMNNLNGRDLADSFSFDPTGSIDGNIDGGTGEGENTLSGRTTQSIFAMGAANGGSLSDASLAKYASFSNIQKLTGRSVSDTLIGSDFATTWTIGSVNELQIDGNTNHVEFTGFEKLQGGNRKDTFAFSADFAGDVDGGDGGDFFNIGSTVARLLGGNGDDQFTLLANGKVASIKGDNGNDTLTGPTGVSNAWVLSAANTGSLNKSTDSVYVTSFESIQSLVGSGNDSLKGIDQNNRWTISDKNKGVLSASNGSNTINFSGMGKLIGGTESDYFDFSADNAAVTIEVDGGDAKAQSNTIRSHTNFKDEWTLTGNNSGSLTIENNPIPYIPIFKNIQKREATDDVTVTGYIDLSTDYDDSGEIKGSLTGSPTVVGFNQNSVWNITGENSGTIVVGGRTIKFSRFANLTGGNQDDQFSFFSGGIISGNIIGGGSDKNSNEINTIIGLDGAANSWQMTAFNSGEVKAAGVDNSYAKFQQIHKIIGGNANDTLRGLSIGDATTVQNWQLNANNENLFYLANPGENIKFSGIENILGGVGANKVTSTAANRTWEITDANRGKINSITFLKINEIQGSGSDSLKGREQDNSWQVTGNGSGTLSQNISAPNDLLKFSGMSRLIGSLGLDVFNFGAIGTVQNVDGGGGINNTIVSTERANSWVIEPNGASRLNSTDNTVATINFENVNNLIGGASFADNFDIGNLGNTKWFFDGGAGTNNTVDLNKISNGVNVTIGVGDTSIADVRIANIGLLKANSNNSNTLFADNIDENIFKVTGNNSGTLNTTLVFTGIANLSGRDLKDTFIFEGATAKLAGKIDGGLGEDTLDLIKLGANANVAVLNDNLAPVANAINITSIDVLSASGSFVNTLTANDKVNVWTINGANSGTLNNSGLASPITFTNFSVLVGGQKDDRFEFSAAGSLKGYIDGASQDSADIVDLSKITGAIEIKLGSVGEGYRRIEQFVGNNADSTLSGDDNNNTWNLLGTNSGNVNGSILFSGFTSLVGGKGDDTFNLLQGQLSDSIHAGAGQDTFNVSNAIVDGSINGEAGDDLLNATISDTFSETIRFIGGVGNNTVTILSKPEDTKIYLATHGAVVAGGGVLRYEENNRTHSINYSNVTTVNDNLIADALTIEGTAAVDLFALSNNSYLLNNFTTVNYQNKNNLIIAGASNDKVSIAMPINIPNALTVKKASVETTGNGLIRANSLVLDGAAAVGSSDNQLKTNVANLSVNTSAGDIYIKELNGLNISSFTSNNKIDLELDGNLTSDVPLASIGQFNVATSGNIILDKSNALTGEVNLKTSKNITFKNGTGTTFGNITADVLNVDSLGSISANGVLSVSGLATFGSGLDIILENAQNDFSAVAISNAQNVSLVDSGLLTLSTAGAIGDIKTQSQGIIVNGAVNSGSLNINAGLGTANLANTINVQTDVGIAAQTIVAAGAINANGSINATSTGEFLQSANISGGSLVLNVGRYNTNANVTTSATNGSVAITSATEIATRNITATNDIILKTLNDLTIGGGISANSGKVDLLAGRNIVVNNEVKGQSGVNIEATNGGIQLQSAITSAAGDLSVTAGSDIVMGANASASAAEGNISYSGKNLTITALSASKGEVIFKASGAVVDGNAEANNISATRFVVDAMSGIGASDDIETSVSGLSLSNQLGDIRLANTGEVTIDRLRTNGNIFFRNTTGDVTLDNRKNSLFNSAEPDALLAGGTVNSSYTIGNLSINMSGGDLIAEPSTPLDVNNPDLTAHNATVIIDGGEFGSITRPLTVYVQDTFFLNATRSWNPFWGFNIRPIRVENISTLQGSLADLLSAGAEQLVEVEELNEINPAIFTNVRNYVYDDIAIMLPADQRYDDDGVAGTN